MYDLFRRLPEVMEMIEMLKEKYIGKRVIVARDKLDPVKGVRQKLLAFELFLNRFPEWQGKVCFFYTCHRIPRYCFVVLPVWPFHVLTRLGSIGTSSPIDNRTFRSSSTSIRFSQSN
jgi:hypothetical protein